MLAGIKLEEQQRQLLGEWVRAHGTPQQVAKRCQIILKSADGKSDKAIAKELDINRHTCRLWRERFAGCGVDCLWEVEAGRGRKSQAGLAQSIIEAPRTKSKPYAIHMTDALPSSIELSPVQREVLDLIVHGLTSTQDQVWPERAILLWSDGVSHSTTARELDVSEETVRILRHRWFSWTARIAAAEKKVNKVFAEIVSLIFQILSEESAPETTLTAPVPGTHDPIHPRFSESRLTLSWLPLSVLFAYRHGGWKRSREVVWKR